MNAWKEIEVTSQAELDAMPLDFNGRIYIKFGTPRNRAIVRNRYVKSSVVAKENSSVVYSSLLSELHLPSASFGKGFAFSFIIITMLKQRSFL